VINVLKKIEIEKRALVNRWGRQNSEAFNILPMYPSPYPSPPGGEGRVRGPFYGYHGKRDVYSIAF